VWCGEGDWPLLSVFSVNGQIWGEWRSGGAVVCEEWEKAVTTRAWQGNVVSECQFHFSVQK